ncbi:hypothetical protein HDU67_004247 [Dinochytrium kinnereticum]|nr:hypothetical protein HDU67_004247 [Dinochytrium kinnereticum]
MRAFNSVFKDGLFAGDAGIYVITGGGTGIGRCMAHELASLGAKVAVLGRRLELLEQTSNEINNLSGSGKCFPYAVNIRDEVKVTELMQRIWSEHGPILGLVNNAGGQFASPAEEISPKGWSAVIDLNLNGTWYVTRAVFLARQNAIASLASDPKDGLIHPPLAIVTVLADIRSGKPYMAHTSAARAGIANLTMTLAQEWGPKGVRINCVTPGTLLGNGMWNYPEAIRTHTASIHHLNPLGRMGTEAEISAAVVFLLSPGAAYITGACLEVTGGAHLRKGVEDPEPFTENSQVPPFFGFSSAVGTKDGTPGYFATGSVPEGFEGVFEKYRKLSKL